MRKDEGNAERQKERKEAGKVGVDRRTRIAHAQAHCIACNFGNPDLLQLTAKSAQKEISKYIKYRVLQYHMGLCWL